MPWTDNIDVTVSVSFGASDGALNEAGYFGAEQAYSPTRFGGATDSLSDGGSGLALSRFSISSNYQIPTPTLPVLFSSIEVGPEQGFGYGTFSTGKYGGDLRFNEYHGASLDLIRWSLQHPVVGSEYQVPAPNSMIVRWG